MSHHPCVMTLKVPLPYTPSVTAQGGNGGTVIASLKDGAKKTVDVDKTKSPTLADPMKS